VQNRAIVFLKAPRAGEVKTRLGREVGMERACEIYQALVGILLKNLQSIPKLELRITPDHADISHWLQPGWTARGQGNGGLTERLQLAFQQGFAEGAQRIVVIGSDCPEVTAADIQNAWAALEEHEVVLGPANDGGYWLVGMRRPLLEIFTEIPWSSDQVLEKTLESARGLGYTTRLLRTLNDVDTIADWERFQRAKR
jgi:uncharacterized protein